jgi:hypothetical protein
MGRKRKSLQDWVKEYEDLAIVETKKKRFDKDLVLVFISETCGESVVMQAEVIHEIPESKPQLICKYCLVEFNYENVHISSRLSEHMKSSSSHKEKKLKMKKREEEGKQFRITEIFACKMKKDELVNSVVHGYVRAQCYDCIPLYKANPFNGKFIKKYIPSAITLPKSDQLYKKYLLEV